MRTDPLPPTTPGLAAVPGREPPAPALGRTAPDAPPAVRVRGLVERYGGRAVVDGVDLGVRCDKVFALLGPNGAGTTTIDDRTRAVLVAVERGLPPGPGRR